MPGAPDLAWRDISDFEDRFEAHIDGLVVGEDLALTICREQAAKGDFGELHAAVCVFCRQKRKDLILEVLEGLDTENVEKMQAFRDALKNEFPEEWCNDFFRMLPGDDLNSIVLLSDVFGYRRMKAGSAFSRILDDIPSGALPSVIRTLGRLREEGSRPALLRHIEHEDESVCLAAALALLRLSEPKVITDCLMKASVRNWPFLPLALGGNRSAVDTLLAQARSRAGFDCLEALGLLGDISAVDVLLAHLNNKDLAEPAALALNLITGAELYEDAFIPDEPGEDELFEGEVEKLKRGGRLYPPGEQPGAVVARLSQKTEDWSRWWTGRRSEFVSGIRYRNGKPYSPACLLENLESARSPRHVRQLAYEELVIRYGADFPFETDMPAAQQKRAISQYARWIKANGSRFHDGQWYFAGQLMA
ncbi:MAG: hypothetical protein V1736_04485 [Pseudomonadota bacterium]